jgi:hypothetical protein
MWEGLIPGTQAKAMAAFLSGEMKDTVQMNPAGAYGPCPGLPCAFLIFLPVTLSSGAVLLTQRTEETVQELGGER